MRNSKFQFCVLLVIGFLFVIGLLWVTMRPQILRVFQGESTERFGAGEAAPNVILILIDALRADSLGCYGYERETSPYLDAFAANNILFENARSQATCTFPSVNSMLTSRYPFHFVKLFKEREFGIPDDLPYLPEILKDNGFTTMAFSSSPIMRNTPSRDFQVMGYGRGFDIFEEYEWKDASVINAAVRKRLRKISEPFFLFLHYMDPHDPYDPPEEFKQAFCTPYDDKDYIMRGDPNPILDLIKEETMDLNLTKRDIQHLKDLYDAEVAFVDREIGIFLDHLSDLDYLENSIIIICADHGEEFLEHKTVKHCMTVYEALVHVPLMMKIPSQGISGRRYALVENMDVVPTILDYSGIDQRGYDFQGTSLKPVIDKDEAIHSHSFCAQYNWRSVTDNRFKLIIQLNTGDIALYDIRDDPGEKINLVDLEAEKARELLRVLKEWISEEEAGLTQEQRIKLSEQAVERLRALGYFK